MYYTIEIAKGDSKIAGKAVYEYETLNEAIACYHKKMGTAMGSDLYTSDMILVIDDKALVYRQEVYTAPETTTETTDATA